VAGSDDRLEAAPRGSPATAVSVRRKTRRGRGPTRRSGAIATSRSAVGRAPPKT